MKRSEAREKVFQVIFQKEFYDDFEERYPFLENELGLKGTQGRYATATIKGILENLEAIDADIERNLRGWTLERHSKQCIALLRLGVYELKYNDEIPDLTAIDEAVKLAHVYCDDNESSFINGILNHLYKEKQSRE